MPPDTPPPSASPVAILRAEDVPERAGSVYPPPFDAICAGRVKRAAGNAMGLSQFGVNHVTLAPGAASAHRHWHKAEDEFVYILSGAATLITNEGAREMPAGSMAGFPAGNPNGHHLVNRSGAPVAYLEVGARAARDEAAYPDVDMRVEKADGQYRFTRRNGAPIDMPA